MLAAETVPLRLASCASPSIPSARTAPEADCSLIGPRKLRTDCAPEAVVLLTSVSRGTSMV